MEQLDDFDGNRRNTNINHFAPLYELDDEEGTKPSPKPKETPVKVQSEDEDADNHKILTERWLRRIWKRQWNW